MLRNQSFFKSGTFPPTYKETGYTGGKNATRSHRAPFENPIALWAELALRISKTGQDGYFMEAVYSSENQLAELDRIARAFNMDINEVSARCDRALRYVTGLCRRWLPCHSCRVKDCPREGKKKAYEYNKYRY